MAQRVLDVERVGSVDSRAGVLLRRALEGLLFITNLPPDFERIEDFGGARTPKFNLVGKEEVNNLEVAQIIADAQGKPL